MATWADALGTQLFDLHPVLRTLECCLSNGYHAAYLLTSVVRTAARSSLSKGYQAACLLTSVVRAADQSSQSEQTQRVSTEDNLVSQTSNLWASAGDRKVPSFSSQV